MGKILKIKWFSKKTSALCFDGPDFKNLINFMNFINSFYRAFIFTGTVFIISLFSEQGLRAEERLSGLDSLYRILDRTIDGYRQYSILHEHRIDSLKRQNRQVREYPALYDSNLQLYHAYKTYIYDSAVQYLEKNLELAETQHDPYRINETRILLSYTFSSAGMYKESIDLLESIDRKEITEAQKRDYYAAYDHAYGELAFYTNDRKGAARYRAVSDAYKDSLFSVLSPESDLYLSMKETAFRDAGQYEEALRINDRRLRLAPPGSPAYAIVAYFRAIDFRNMGNPAMEKRYLALSALADLQSATKDHASLWMLAERLYHEGDIKRAHRYIRFSWQETAFFNARLRNWQSSGILSIIDQNFQIISRKQNHKLRFSLAVISALSLLLLAAIAYVYRQMRKLDTAQKHLADMNRKLQQLNGALSHSNTRLNSANKELSEANRIKEEYIGRFLSLCSAYIDKLDRFQKIVNKKIANGQTNELLKLTRSPEFREKELSELYSNFDSAFLHLFPNFVEAFNALLEEDSPVILKNNERLNTELRIFALIRLGIDDSSRIAEFLHYSVNTIYNYRAKVKNKARVPRDEFENLVKQIGNQ